MVPTLVAQISDVRQIGVRNGTNFFVVSFAALCGNPTGGALIAQDQADYTYLQIFSGLTMAVGGCLYAASRRVQVGAWQWRKL